MDERCGECRFYRSARTIYGICRVGPPRMWGDISGEKRPVEFRVTDGVWPTVTIDDWCGQFEALDSSEKVHPEDARDWFKKLNKKKRKKSRKFVLESIVKHFNSEEAEIDRDGDVWVIYSGHSKYLNPDELVRLFTLFKNKRSTHLKLET